MVHDGARAGRAVVRRTTKTEERKPRWLLLLLSVLLVPLVLALLTLAFTGQDIEDTLTGKAKTALAGAGLGGVGVHFDGRDGSLTGVPDGQRDKARGTVEGVDGVRSAEVTDAKGNLDVRSDDTTVTVSGTVPDKATRDSVISQVKENAGDKKVADELEVSDGALLPGNSDKVGALAGAMAADQPGNRQLTWNNDGVKITGDLPDGKGGDAVTGAVDAALPGTEVDNQLEKTKQQLQAEIDEYLAANPIRFRPHSAELTPGGKASVEHVATLLTDRPEIELRVEGNAHPSRAHRTESSPYQQRLSDRRADTVKQALADLGVPADNITAEGLGIEGPNPDRRADIKIL